jgi:uncharacterized protein
MTDEERRIITEFVQRVAGASAPASASSPWGGAAGRGSVPSSQPPLPPVDREADSLIADLFNRYPEARYRLTQTAFVQEHALAEAQNRIRQLEWQLGVQQRQAEVEQQPKGLLGGLFGGGGQQPRPVNLPPPPQPMHAPGYQQFQQQGRSGGGFLGTAVAAAAGVAGGMMLGNMLSGALGGAGGAAHAAEAAGSAISDAGGWAQQQADQASQWVQQQAPEGWGEEEEP